jgi:hypothetical protein
LVVCFLFVFPVGVAGFLLESVVVGVCCLAAFANAYEIFTFSPPICV